MTELVWLAVIGVAGAVAALWILRPQPGPEAKDRRIAEIEQRLACTHEPTPTIFPVRFGSTGFVTFAPGTRIVTLSHELKHHHKQYEEAVRYWKEATSKWQAITLEQARIAGGMTDAREREAPHPNRSSQAVPGEPTHSGPMDAEGADTVCDFAGWTASGTGVSDEAGGTGGSVGVPDG